VCANPVRHVVNRRLSFVIVLTVCRIDHVSASLGRICARISSTDAVLAEAAAEGYNRIQGGCVSGSYPQRSVVYPIYATSAHVRNYHYM
jgi:hypothetical protein